MFMISFFNKSNNLKFNESALSHISDTSMIHVCFLNFIISFLSIVKELNVFIKIIQRCWSVSEVKVSR
jgi:hypothetical protein